MTTDLLTNWALIAVSLFNTIIFLWLGMTLWLNADRRTLGLTVTAIGFMLVALFFISQSALWANDSLILTRSNTLWVAVGVMPLVLLPYVWYVVILWSSGFWPMRAITGQRNSLHRRHHPWLWFTGIVLGIGLLALALLGLPYLPIDSRLLPAAIPWRELLTLRELLKQDVQGVPLVVIAYPVYVLLCVVLSLDALYRPGPTADRVQVMARRRAKPWLIAASLLLIVVGLLLAAVLMWTTRETKVGNYYILHQADRMVISRFDLIISILVAVLAVLLGQAITAYELFTGRLLPRRGMARHWNRALILATGYGLLVGGVLAFGLEPVYAVLLTAVLMTSFFALLSWRAYAEREQAIQQVRPFVASPRWYDYLVANPKRDEGISSPFQALCTTLLNTIIGYLIPAGPVAAFVSPLSYPLGKPIPDIGSLLQSRQQWDELIIAIQPASHGGAGWAIPLWSERGVIGFLLLGPRQGGGLYSQEEIEIARATGERLLDTAASIALSQRLMRLQRERMAATQVLDQRTRRVLHDEVLPLIQTAMISLDQGESPAVTMAQLSGAHQEVSDLLRELPMTITPDIARLGITDALRKMVDAEFARAFDQVEWRLESGVNAAARRLSPLAAETIYHAAREMIRNAAKHGRATDRDDNGRDKLTLTMIMRVARDQLQIMIEDDGVGLAPTRGDGQGIALHSTLVAIAGGSLAVESIPGRMTRATLSMPLGDDDGALMETIGA